MGLDWNPLARPKPGMEAEFDRLFRELDAPYAPRLRMLAIVLGRRTWSKAEREVRLRRFREISEAPFQTLGAPRVGIDQAADDWLRSKVAAGDAEAFERERTKMRGLYVLDLLPPCDGFPLYSNYGAYEGLDRYSFRAQFLDDAKEIIGADLHARAWTRMLAPELAAYAAAMEARTRPWAERAGVARVETAAEPPEFREDDPASQADILFSAIRWCRFWASRGHGLDPWF